MWLPEQLCEWHVENNRIDFWNSVLPLLLCICHLLFVLHELVLPIVNSSSLAPPTFLALRTIDSTVFCKLDVLVLGIDELCELILEVGMKLISDPILTSLVPTSILLFENFQYLVNKRLLLFGDSLPNFFSIEVVDFARLQIYEELHRNVL